MTSLLPDIDKGSASAFRVAFGLAGLVTAVFGLLVLIWPGKTALVVTALIAVYAIIVGIVYAAIALFTKVRSGWSRIGHGVLAVLYVVTGIIALTNLRPATGLLALFVAVLVGVTWIVEGLAALLTLKASAAKGWTIFFSIISILAGISLVTAPLWGAALLWWIVGISLVLIGALQIGRAFAFGKLVKA